MFNLAVDNDGYAWWYLDAISDDQDYAITIIAFIGSVFSPYYARARRRSSTNPLEHCAVNAIVYGKNVGRWAMTERSASAVQQSADCLQIGPSQLLLDSTSQGQRLRIHIDEITAPIPRRLCGEITVSLPSISTIDFDLDRDGRHRWTPIAPSCRIDVHLQHPDIRWQGQGYFDHNRGTEPIDQGFLSWNWSRLHSQNGDTIVFYDRILRDQSTAPLLLVFDSSGALIQEKHGAAALRKIELVQTPLSVTSLWRMPRCIRSDQATQPRIVRTLEDTPFYARSEIEAVIGGLTARGVHESISLVRLVKPVVQCMLPFRMPRRS